MYIVQGYCFLAGYNLARPGSKIPIQTMSRHITERHSVFETAWLLFTLFFSHSTCLCRSRCKAGNHITIDYHLASPDADNREINQLFTTERLVIDR